MFDLVKILNGAGAGSGEGIAGPEPPTVVSAVQFKSPVSGKLKIMAFLFSFVTSVVPSRWTDKAGKIIGIPPHWIDTETSPKSGAEVP